MRGSSDPPRQDLHPHAGRLASHYFREPITVFLSRLFRSWKTVCCRIAVFWVLLFSTISSIGKNFPDRTLRNLAPSQSHKSDTHDYDTILIFARPGSLFSYPLDVKLRVVDISLLSMSIVVCGTLERPEVKRIHPQIETNYEIRLLSTSNLIVLQCALIPWHRSPY